MKGTVQLLSMLADYVFDGSASGGSGDTNEHDATGTLVSLPANFLKVGMTFDILLSGVFNTGEVAPDGLTLRCYWTSGSPVELFKRRLSGVTVNPVVHPFLFRERLVVRSVGASGKVMPTGYTDLGTGSGVDPTTERTVDTTVAGGLKITGQWSGTAGAFGNFLTANVNIAKLRMAVISYSR